MLLKWMLAQHDRPKQAELAQRLTSPTPWELPSHLSPDGAGTHAGVSAPPRRLVDLLQLISATPSGGLSGTDPFASVKALGLAPYFNPEVWPADSGLHLRPALPSAHGSPRPSLVLRPALPAYESPPLSLTPLPRRAETDPLEPILLAVPYPPAVSDGDSVVTDQPSEATGPVSGNEQTAVGVWGGGVGSAPQAGYPHPPDSDAGRNPALPPTRSALDESLDQMLRNHRAMVSGWRQQELDTSADHLERYLDGAGSTLRVGRDDARKFAPFRQAEADNIKRFEDSFLLPGVQRGHAEKLTSLKDGQTVVFSDNWDRAITPGYLAGTILRDPGQAFDPNMRDFALAYGRVTLRSGGTFTATRRGDEIHIEGPVTHGFSDRYDFNPGEPYSAGRSELERHRGAKPFDRVATWPRYVAGTIKIKDGKLSHPTFTWSDFTGEGLEP